MRLNLQAAAALVVAGVVTAWAGTVPPPAATPEPGTIAMLGGGLAALGVIGWRRRRNKN